MPSPGIDSNALDRYITGNYGEDQFEDDLYPDEGIEETYPPIDEELEQVW